MRVIIINTCVFDLWITSCPTLSYSELCKVKTTVSLSSPRSPCQWISKASLSKLNLGAFIYQQWHGSRRGPDREQVCCWGLSCGSSFHLAQSCRSSRRLCGTFRRPRNVMCRYNCAAGGVRGDMSAGRKGGWGLSFALVWPGTLEANMEVLSELRS